MPTKVKSTRFFNVFSDGRIQFTDEGFAEFREPFAKLGVDIGDVSTKEFADKLIDRVVAHSLGDDTEEC
jgi:lipoate-protein ligase A